MRGARWEFGELKSVSVLSVSRLFRSRLFTSLNRVVYDTVIVGPVMPPIWHYGTVD